MDINSGDVLRVACRLRDGYGSDILNVFHYVYTGSSTSSTVVGPLVRLALDSAYNSANALIPTDTDYIDIDLTNATTGAVEAAQPWPAMTTGAGAGDQMPSDQCGLLVGRTDFSRVLARKFIGPIIESWNDDGQWSSGAVTLLTGFLADWLSNIAIGGLGQLSPVVAKYVAGVLDSFKYINGGYTSSGSYNQRRRRPGVGV
jgi:hypothetical protein